MAKKVRVSRRRKLVCSNGSECKGGCGVAGHEFSTHSSIRTKCHTCSPKCTEQHFFDARRWPAKKKEEQPAEVPATDGAQQTVVA